MIEVVAAVSAATSAFNTIKKGIAVGRDIEDMAGSLSKWMGAAADIDKAGEYAKNPPLFKKLFASGSVEEEAMQTFMAKKKAEDMRDQLRQIIQMTRGHNAWNDLLKTEAEVRKKRQKLIYDQKERQKFWLEVSAIILLVLMIAGSIGFVIFLYMETRGMI